MDALIATIGQQNSPLVAALLHPIVIRDAYGKTKDEWDGCAIVADAEDLRLLVVEAKRGTNRARRAQEAFDQLVATRRLLKSRYSVGTKRSRLQYLGAYLEVLF